MNFQYLITVQPPDHYLNTAFKEAQHRADILRSKHLQKVRRPLPIQPEKRKYIINKTKLNTSKDIELERIHIVEKSLTGQLDAILKSFPSLDALPPFYLELLKVTIEYPLMKQSLGAVHWAQQKITEFYRITNEKIKRTYDLTQINVVRRAFYGRVSSLLKQIKDNLAYLEECRRIMKRFPTIRTAVPTVAIAGYPNVGKSTLLRALTTSTPEVAPYPFTTKELNVGYMKQGYKEMQIIDVPGTFDRNFLQMNMIEKQAVLVLKHLAEVIVFIMDPTETCGYSLEEQLSLLNRIEKQFSVPIIVVANKADLGEKQIEKEHLVISAEKGIGIDELKKKLNEVFAVSVRYSSPSS